MKYKNIIKEIFDALNSEEDCAEMTLSNIGEIVGRVIDEDGNFID